MKGLQLAKSGVVWASNGIMTETDNKIIIFFKKNPLEHIDIKKMEWGRIGKGQLLMKEQVLIHKEEILEIEITFLNYQRNCCFGQG